MEEPGRPEGMEARYVVFEMYPDGDSDALSSFDDLQAAYDDATARTFAYLRDNPLRRASRVFGMFGVHDRVSKKDVYPTKP